jgi:predicted RNA-binding protein with PIN domain
MREQWLIDGYNLLHALGLLRRDAGDRALENARRRLLHYLHDALGDDPPTMTVVFDAAAPPPGVPAEFDFHRLHVRFAVGHDEADDLIEHLIRQCPSPRHLRVVSDDHRLQRAARRRECVLLGCQDFLEKLPTLKAARPAPPPKAGPEEKKGEVSEPEKDRLLEEFKRLLDDREFDDFFDPYGSSGP